MSSAREEILERIRSSNRVAKAVPGTSIERGYRRAGALSRGDVVALLINRLEDYGAGIFRCDDTSVAETVATALARRQKKSLAIPPQFPEEWLPHGIDFIRDQRLSYSELSQCEGALTACTAAIAMTGAILLSHREREGRRALSLIPDYHLCVVSSQQLVETVPEGLARLKEFRCRPITTIAGPSATADIEMIRVKGVHGPRTLDVILVGEK